jgi:O-antigen ligase
MVKAHPINGVGVSAFRFAYPEFAKPGDPFMQQNHFDEETGRPTGQMYAHQMVLEVLSETGLIGLTGLVLFYSLLVRSWHRASQERRIHSLPFAMGLLAWIFPLNTHPSFYSAQWSVMIWLMIAMLCASLYPLQKQQSTVHDK